MSKEPLSTSTEEVPKHKPALLDKIKAEKNQRQIYQKKNPLNYQNQLDGDF